MILFKSYGKAIMRLNKKDKMILGKNEKSYLDEYFVGNYRITSETETTCSSLQTKINNHWETLCNAFDFNEYCKHLQNVSLSI